MKTKFDLTRLTLWITRLIAAILFVLLFTMPALLDWYSKGIFTPEDVEKKDSRTRKKPTTAANTRTEYIPGGDDLDRAERMLNNTKR